MYELIENASVPILYILRLTSMRLYSSRGVCARKRDDTVTTNICPIVCAHLSLSASAHGISKLFFIL